MKRYDIYSECLCGIGFEPSYEESFRGAWVDADIAQELYDALENILNDTNLDIEAIDKIQAKEAIDKADEE